MYNLRFFHCPEIVFFSCLYAGVYANSHMLYFRIQSKYMVYIWLLGKYQHFLVTASSKCQVFNFCSQFSWLR